MSGKNIYGLSLLELLVTLLVFSCLSLMVIPSFINYQSRQGTSLKTWEIKRALDLARSFAISKLKPVKACPTNLNFACIAESGVRFLVFDDANRNHIWDGDESIFKDIGMDDFNIKLSASGRAFIRFKPTGESMESGNILVCDSHKSDYARQVIVYQSGRIRMSKDTNLDGYDDKSGSNIICKW